MLMKKQISDFQANGVVLLKGVLNDFVNDARVAIEENMAQPSWRERTYHKDDGSAPFFQDYVVWNQFDGYRKLVRIILVNFLFITSLRFLALRLSTLQSTIGHLQSAPSMRAWHVKWPQARVVSAIALAQSQL